MRTLSDSSFVMLGLADGVVDDDLGFLLEIEGEDEAEDDDLARSE